MADTLPTLSYRNGRLFGLIEPRLWPLIPLYISLLGIPTIFITRWLATLYHPGLWGDTIPTISKVAAFAPDSTVFAIGMTAASVGIVLVWPMFVVLNLHRVEVYARSGRERRVLQGLILVAALFGIAAGVFLGSLANITLEDNDPVHVLLSKLFFGSQVAAFILDTLAARRLRRLSVLRHGRPAFGLSGKPWVTLAVSLFAAFFLFMFIYKDTGLFTDQHLVRIVYTGSELILAVLCFVYPAAYYPETRDYFGSPFAPLRRMQGPAEVLPETETP